MATGAAARAATEAETPNGAAIRPDAVVAELRGAILAGGFAPGAAVTEALVAERFTVARPTARIAIDRLVAEGLLAREPHHAARVPLLDRSDIADLFQARAAVEAAAVEMLAQRGTVPAEATAAHDALSALGPDASYSAADIAFHRALVRGAPSVRLPRLHELLMGEIELAIAQVDAQRLRSAREVATEHGAVLDAIATGKTAQAAALIRDHILSSRDRLLAHHDSTHGR